LANDQREHFAASASLCCSEEANGSANCSKHGNGDECQDIGGLSNAIGDGSVCMDVVADELQPGEGAKHDAHRLKGCS
jgi:hypothetical protein